MRPAFVFVLGYSLLSIASLVRSDPFADSNVIEKRQNRELALKTIKNKTTLAILNVQQIKLAKATKINV